MNLNVSFKRLIKSPQNYIWKKTNWLVNKNKYSEGRKVKEGRMMDENEGMKKIEKKNERINEYRFKKCVESCRLFRLFPLLKFSSTVRWRFAPVCVVASCFFLWTPSSFHIPRYYMCLPGQPALIYICQLLSCISFSS